VSVTVTVTSVGDECDEYRNVIKMKIMSYKSDFWATVCKTVRPMSDFY